MEVTEGLHREVSAIERRFPLLPFPERRGPHAPCAQPQRTQAEVLVKAGAGKPRPDFTGVSTGVQGRAEKAA